MALITCDFFSDVLGVSTSMTVILPQGARPKRGHPVLYLLHGYSDDHTIWLRRTSVERYVAPLGLAVVMPGAHLSYYADMRHGGRYWTFVSQELPAIVASFFPVSGRREDTFAAGLSMGGYGAFKLALAQPERFAAAASLSGAMDVARLHDKPGRKAKREGQSACIFGETGPVAGTGHDLFHLAAALARRRTAPRPRLYQCCGTEDFLHQDNVKFRDFARAKGLDLTYEEGPGAHEWGYWDAQIQRVLAWLPLKRG